MPVPSVGWLLADEAEYDTSECGSGGERGGSTDVIVVIASCLSQSSFFTLRLSLLSKKGEYYYFGQVTAPFTH